MVGDEEGGLPVEARADIAKRALGPAADEFGKEFAPAGKEAGEVAVRATRAIIKTLKGVIWGVEKVQDWLESAVASRLANKPQEELTSANPRILFPAVQALVYTGPDEEIRELFANLIASDMTISGKPAVHPSFVEVVKQLSGLDARTLKYIVDHGPQRHGYFREYERDYNTAKIADLGQPNPWIMTGEYYSVKLDDVTHDALAVAVANLMRLGLLIEEDHYPSGEKLEAEEKRILALPEIEALVNRAKITKKGFELNTRGIYLTAFGRRFVSVCLSNS